ncbi:MAG: molybdopterin-guanine dinucleotide biosynthesis protein B [Betaproteobacteria bacterium RIFCSPLOWO2_12_FULL_65_14]|nr:MAG: molybdopterin-guanine dinucleotide biosynthesis protein B [Betaproteobacteria bacterium RIFCSPLOWO2_12_FULL_65_14]
MRIFGFAGFSGSGKTTLIEKLVPLLTGRGLRISLIKHAHHAFDVDRPGKDSYRHREAGCSEVLVSSSNRWALMHELRGAPEPSLYELVGRLSPCDLVLVEGFKREPIPKLEIHRAAHAGAGLIFPHDPHILGIATDVPLATRLPVFDLEDFEGIGDFIFARGLRLPHPRLQLVGAKST